MRPIFAEELLWCTVLENLLVDEHAGDCVSIDAFQRECVRERGEPVDDERNEAVAILGLRERSKNVDCYTLQRCRRRKQSKLVTLLQQPGPVLSASFALKHLLSDVSGHLRPIEGAADTVFHSHLPQVS